MEEVQPLEFQQTSDLFLISLCCVFSETEAGILDHVFVFSLKIVAKIENFEKPWQSPESNVFSTWISS